MAKDKGGNIFIEMKPLYRVLLSALFSGIAFLFIRTTDLNNTMIGMVLWDVFALTYLINSWIVIFTSETHHITKRARQEDGGRVFVFLIVVVSSFASMITVLLLIISKDTESIPKTVYLPVTICGILLSWLMVHSTYTFHYAHLYYDTDEGSTKCNAGLEFPKNEDDDKPDEPDYLDFAYFSFVIGMTFQVSDVEISSRVIRRKALAHGLISFILNTFVVALTINLIAGLKN